MKYFVRPCWHTQTGYSFTANSLEEAEQFAQKAEWDYCCQNNLHCSNIEVVEVVENPEKANMFHQAAVCSVDVYYNRSLMAKMDNPDVSPDEWWEEYINS